jgi:hypothetical protein
VLKILRLRFFPVMAIAFTTNWAPVETEWCIRARTIFFFEP